MTTKRLSATEPPRCNCDGRKGNAGCPCPVHEPYEYEPAAAPTGAPRPYGHDSTCAKYSPVRKGLPCDCGAEPPTAAGTLRRSCGHRRTPDDYCPECEANASPTETGEGSERLNPDNYTGKAKLFAEALNHENDLKAENAALRSQLEEGLAAWQINGRHELDGPHAECACSSCNLRRELATAQARIACVEEAVQEFGHHHSSCDIMFQSHIYQECTCGYWKFCKVCQSKPEARAALAEPQSGDTK